MALCRRQSKTWWTAEEQKSGQFIGKLGMKSSLIQTAHWNLRRYRAEVRDLQVGLYPWGYLSSPQSDIGNRFTSTSTSPHAGGQKKQSRQAEFSCLFWQERAGESAEDYLLYSWHSWQRGAACKDKSSKFPAKCHPFQEADRVRVWTGLEVVSTPLTMAGLMLTGFLSRQTLIREGFCSREMRNLKYITLFPFCFCV